jgi:hypothetical protein
MLIQFVIFGVAAGILLALGYGKSGPGALSLLFCAWMVAFLAERLWRRLTVLRRSRPERFSFMRTPGVGSGPSA